MKGRVLNLGGVHVSSEIERILAGQGYSWVGVPLTGQARKRRPSRTVVFGALELLQLGPPNASDVFWVTYANSALWELAQEFCRRTGFEPIKVFQGGNGRIVLQQGTQIIKTL